MRYSEAIFKIQPNNEAAGDVLAASLAEIGFDTFVPNDEGLTAYVQTAALDVEAVGAAVADFPLPGVDISFEIHDVPDENWNATWESEHHFEPIELTNGKSFKIVPRQAFGSGEHATTKMMIRMLASLDVNGCSAIDAGCGTGVLSLAAVELGAAHVFAYDIDEWSVRNAEDNFKLNGYTPQPDGCEDEVAYPVRIVHGDASCLDAMAAGKGVDIVMANINRNILLADMPAFVSHLNRGGHLLLSGFYPTDAQQLTEAAQALGLTLAGTEHEGDWAALHFTL